MGQLNKQQVYRLSEEVWARTDLVKGFLRTFWGFSNKFASTEVVDCPACGGTGWLDVSVVESCPYCRGWCKVSKKMAAMFRLNHRRFLRGLDFSRCRNTDGSADV